MEYYTIIYLIILILIILHFIIKQINKSMIYQPYIPTEEEYESTLSNKNIAIDNLMLTTKNNQHINVLWLNKNKNKDVIIFAHGNSGWCGSVLNSKIISILLNYGSVIIFDYCGYGFSSGSPSEKQTEYDIATVYDYLIDHQKIDNKNIILYGFSLGTGVATKLVSTLDNKKSPKIIILEAPYISVKKVSDDIFPFLNYLVLINYNNDENIKMIKENNIDIKIIILHSEDDEIIKYYHGEYLSKEHDIKLYKLSGGHNDADYGNNFKEIFNF